MSTFALRSLSWSLVLGLGLVANAQDPPRSGETPSSASAAEFPFEGEVTCENLNVRLAPRTDAATGVVAVLRQGEKVVAVGTSGEFLIVRAPRGATAWVSGKHVKREADGSGSVIVNDAALRMDSRAGAEKIGSLKEGDRVSIVKEHLGWFQVSAPTGVKYYVAKKFVRFLAAMPDAAPEVKIAPVIQKEGGLSDAAANAKMDEAQTLVAAQSKLIAENKLTEVDFAGVVAAYEEAVNVAKTDGVKRQAEKEHARYRDFQNLLVTVKGNIAAVEELINSKKSAIENQFKPAAPKWEACGYVDTVGPLFYRPGAFKLMMSGKIVAFVRVKDGDEEMRLRMNKLYGRYVGVVGSVLKDPPGWPDHRVVTVDQVEELLSK